MDEGLVEDCDCFGRQACCTVHARTCSGSIGVFDDPIVPVTGPHLPPRHTRNRGTGKRTNPSNQDFE
ncbi:hypothetical protein HMPREF0682_2227 [Propionibacterium acidifaciens F0233]|uniref:Uncharacterized protein n=1 Tax=Propionibacterium acidifaciens F0233 TaxID=553198 RepID=U2RBD6_9ACTN|nr:hypothetical protein HMPREF0682_2227 [Propionibacterium acidifaciens F0233]